MGLDLLPEEFKALQPYIEWALPTERERNQKRVHSQMADIRAFYDAIFPQIPAIVEYLNEFPLQEMPAPEQRLLQMALSLAEVANAVELFKEPDVIDGFPTDQFIPIPD